MLAALLLLIAAEEVTVVVAPIVVGESSAVRAADLEVAVAVAARRRERLRMMSSEELFSLGVRVEAALACGADSACASALLARSRADVALLVVANVLSDPPILAIRAIDLASGRMIGSSAAPVTEPDWPAAVTARADAIFQAAGYALVTRSLVLAPPVEPESTVLDSPWFWAAALGGAALIAGGVAIIAAAQGSACVCLGSATQTCPPC